MVLEGIPNHHPFAPLFACIQMHPTEQRSILLIVNGGIVNFVCSWVKICSHLDWWVHVAWNEITPLATSAAIKSKINKYSDFLNLIWDCYSKIISIEKIQLKLYISLKFYVINSVIILYIVLFPVTCMPYCIVFSKLLMNCNACQIDQIEQIN